jgi:hypothetical protein
MSLATSLQLFAPLVTRTPMQLVRDSTPRAPGKVLSAAELRQFSDQGFLTIQNLCSAVELESMRAVLLPLFQGHVGRDEGDQFDMLGLDLDVIAPRQPQIIKPSTYAPALRGTAYFHSLTAIARQLLGSDAQFSFDHSILKPGGSAAPTPWHQDEAHHSDPAVRFQQVSFWLALQDTPVELGCMRYIPGSNHGPVLPHHFLNGDSRIHALECSVADFDASQAVSQPIAAGSCIVHSGRTLHSALPNFSAADRVAYIVAFTAAPSAIHKTQRLTMVAGNTASMRRRNGWLLHGGFLVHGLRRLRQGLRADPRSHWPKLRLLAHSLGMRIRGSTHP